MASRIVTAAQMKHCDSYTINEIGIPGMVLMERAALAVRDEILTSYPLDLAQVVVVVGSGNNGGDGLAIARLLKIAGVNVKILTVGNPDHASTQNQAQTKICQYYQIPMTNDLAILQSASLIIDAIFGIGIDRPITGHYQAVINAINGTNAIKVAVDIPSGINTDTGAIMNVAVRADLTITFAFNKLGLTKTPGKDYAGRVIVASDMGIYWIDD